jgi:hypothetical protein
MMLRAMRGVFSKLTRTTQGTKPAVSEQAGRSLNFTANVPLGPSPSGLNGFEFFFRLSGLWYELWRTNENPD